MEMWLEPQQLLSDLRQAILIGFCIFLALYLNSKIKDRRSIELHDEFSIKAIKLLGKKAEAQQESLQIFHENEKKLLKILRTSIADMRARGSNKIAKILEESLQKQIEFRNTQAQRLNGCFSEISESTINLLSLFDKDIADTSRAMLARKATIICIDPDDNDFINV